MKIGTSLRTKAIIGFAAFLVLLSAVSIDTLIEYGKLRSQVAENRRDSDAILELSNEVRLLLSKELIDTQKYLLRFDQEPPAELQQISREVYDRQVRYLKLPLNREERFQLERIKVLNARVEEQLTIAVYLHALSRQNDARNQMLKAAPLVDELQTELLKLMTLERDRYNQLTTQSQATSVFLSRRIVIIALAIAVLGLGFTLLIFGRIIKPVLELADAAKKVGKGQLGVKVPVKHSDEMGLLEASFNEMSQSLKFSHQQLQLKNQQLKSALEEKEDFLRAVS